MSDYPTANRRLNPGLGWFFSPADVAAESAARQADLVTEFAAAFVEFLGGSQERDVLRSGVDTPADDSVIVFTDHGAVYVPSRYFADPDDPIPQFREFTDSDPGGRFAGWTWERDSEVHASGGTGTLVAPAEDVREAVMAAPATLTPATIPVTVYWHLLQVLAEPLWPNGLGEGSVVAVLDTGLDLNNNLLTDGSLGGVSFVPGNPSYADDNGHGTHVTGLVAARPGVSADGRPLYWSIAPGASHYSVKVLDNNGSGGSVAIAQGLDWARARGVDVISMSLGSTTELPTVVRNAVTAAAAEAVLVSAAGNDGPGANTVEWPARYREVIGVGAVDRNRVVASFSSRGPADPNAFVEDNVECVAPGVDVFSNQRGGSAQQLVAESGTSMATPIVSAICALLKQKDPALRGTTAFRFRLRRSIIDLGIGGPDNFYGLGLVHFDPSS